MLEPCMDVVEWDGGEEGPVIWPDPAVAQGGDRSSCGKEEEQIPFPLISRAEI